MECKPPASAAKSALDLIHNQDGPALLRELTSCPIELFRDGSDTPFTLNRFDQDSADILAQLPLEIPNVIEIHEIEAGDQRLKLFAILFLPRRR